MRNKDAFSGYHPVINFLYYALVLLFSMCLMHPVYLAVSLVSKRRFVLQQNISDCKTLPQ